MVGVIHRIRVLFVENDLDMMNPRLSIGVTMALTKVKDGVPIRQAAAECGVWPQAVYQAIKREGIKLPKPKTKKKKAVAK